MSAPSFQDQQRYVLLEALMKAGKRLYFSYERMDAHDAKEKHVSRLVEQIHGEIEHHPPLSAHGRALSMPLLVTREKERMEGSSVTISQLKTCGRSALQLYVNAQWGAVQKMEGDEENGRFALSPLDKAIFRKQVPSANGLIKTRLPQGAFREVALRELTQEALEVNAALAEFGLCADQVRRIRFVQGLRQQVDDCYPMSGAEGVLEGVTSQGLVYDGECNAKGLMRVFPLYLIYRQLYPDQPYILFIKDRKRLEIPLGCPKQVLNEYIQFYRKALHECCPLTSSNVRYFFDNDREGFESFLPKDKDPYVQLFKRRGALGELLPLFDVWQPQIVSLFAPAIEVLT